MFVLTSRVIRLAFRPLALYAPCKRVLMDKATLYPDLAEIASKSSYKQIFDIFYALAQVRYATFKQLHPLNHRVATKTNLVKFCEFGYLDGTFLVKDELALHVTDKTRQILEREGFNVKVIQKKFTGQELTHALKISDCILKLQAQENFYNVFYPIFREPPKYDREFLRPDACVVWKKDGAYKIQFVEVEEAKPDWENYLLVKRQKYEQLANDQNIYRVWWKYRAEKLILPLCSEADFCFSVICFANINKNWGGWEWIKMN
jgi:hypothetical protein